MTSPFFSIFSYTGRTQKEIIDFVRENYVKRQSFQRYVVVSTSIFPCIYVVLILFLTSGGDRSQSFRHTSPLHTTGGGVGTSLSVHPLLPVGDNVIGNYNNSSTLLVAVAAA